MHIVKYCSLVLVYITFICDASAQYHFINYDETNGLPLDEVNVIAEDSIGYMWFGGPEGLVRFDGHQFTHYYRGSEAGDMAGNIINDITVTSRGDVIAVYEDNGISICNHETGTFRTKRYQSQDSTNFPKHAIIFVYAESDTIAYLGAIRQGLYRMNLNNFTSQKVEADKIPFDMKKDPSGNNGTYLISGGGLFRYNKLSNQLSRLTDHGHAGIEIVEDDIWLNEYTGKIIRYNTKTQQVDEYNLQFPGVVRGWTTVNNNLWVGTAEGLEIIDISSGKIIAVLRSDSTSSNLGGTFIYDVYKDKKGRIWVASDGGLGMYNPSLLELEATDLLQGQSTFLTHLTDGRYLSCDFYNTKIEIINSKVVSTSVDIPKKLLNPIKSINGDKHFIFYNGIASLDLSSKKLSDHDCPPTRSGTRGLIDVLKKQEDWLGIYRHQHMMLHWNKKSPSSDTLHLDGEPRGMIDTHDGNVWIYGVGVLWKYNVKNRSSTMYPLDHGPLVELGDIVKIDRGTDHFWISTKMNGIWKANYDNNQFTPFRKYGRNEGLLNEGIIETVTTKDGVLIAQSRAGIFIYDDQKDRFIQAGGKKTMNFQTTYGLSVIDNILYVLGYKSKSLNLNLFSHEVSLPKFHIRSLSVNGNQRPISDSSRLVLNHKENNLSLAYSTLNFSDPSSTKVRYKLHDEDSWIYPKTYTQNIHLSALAAGEYDIKISTSRGDGLWTVPANISLLIRPPYWRSWWFLLLVLIGTFGLVYLLYRFRLGQQKKLVAMQVKIAEIESESLRAQMNPHFVFNALNSIKSYIIKSSKEEAADYLTTFSELIRAVLRNSKQNEISLESELEALSLYLQIENIRLLKTFDYTIEVSSDLDPSHISIPPLIIQPFVENSVWHGFMHKNTPGLLSVFVSKKEEKLKIVITDDGVGRAKSKEIEKNRDRKRSYGIAITETRLANLADETDIYIEDLFNKEEESTGTKVTLILPYKKFNNIIQRDVKN